MTYCCSQCNFTAQFESALRMHHQLHHEPATLNGYPDSKPKLLTEKSNTVPRAAALDASFSSTKESKGFKLASRTSSATRLLDKLRSRITRSRSRILFSHPEESSENNLNTNDHSISSDCTSKALESSMSKSSAITTPLVETKETYGCHLCSFDADRITVLDRHLLNDHKIGLDNLLKLVLAKTKDGLSEECPNQSLYGIRQPYYKATDEIIEEGEFVIETVSPKIRILKHTSTNTDIQWNDIPDLKDNCRMITKELEKLMKYPVEKCDKDELLAKMQTLNECMGKFVDSTNTIKRVLTKEYDSKTSVRDRLSTAEPFFDLGLGEFQEFILQDYTTFTGYVSLATKPLILPEVAVGGIGRD
ncbi:uncharacterized protein LOC135084745 [Ostrinia nubilalis]|uniref:uncharacterized protein LOC135084745 n=1 Tax=Ostrinia nubilalis TaxID=29057 RepID=UPI0030824078